MDHCGEAGGQHAGSPPGSQCADVVRTSVRGRAEPWSGPRLLRQPLGRVQDARWLGAPRARLPLLPAGALPRLSAAEPRPAFRARHPLVKARQAVYGNQIIVFLFHNSYFHRLKKRVSHDASSIPR